MFCSDFEDVVTFALHMFLFFVIQAKVLWTGFNCWFPWCWYLYVIIDICEIMKIWLKFQAPAEKVVKNRDLKLIK